MKVNIPNLIRKSIFLIILTFIQSNFAFPQTIKPPRFLKETRKEYIFMNQESRLVIRKEKWNMKLLGEDGFLCYAEGKAPSFLIDDKWVSLLQAGKVISQDEKSVRIQTLLSNGGKAEVEVKSVSDYGFNIIIRCKDIVVSAVRGVTHLNRVEEVYGFGELWNGRVSQRGQSFDLWDKGGTPDECAYMPYYVSTNNYTFFLNYGGLVSFDVGRQNPAELTYRAPAPGLDITLISGNSVAEAVQNFLSVKGLPVSPPRWAYEPWFWLMQDPVQPNGSLDSLKGEHFITMINKLRELDIPIGVTWLEPPWQDARTSFIPNPEFSRNLKDLIRRINDKGVKALAWTVPYTTVTASNWKEAVEKGYLIRRPEGKKAELNFNITASGELAGNFYTFIDFFNPDAVKWWQGQVEKSLELGLSGFKLDAGQDIPKDAILYGGLLGKDVHNSYALEYNKVFYNALKKKLGDDFLMIPRAAWTGSPSYTNFKWPGDLSCSFNKNGLPSTVYSSLSLAFCGIPFVSTDIGGFEGRPSPENVWIRWAQFGAFLPGMQTLNMPWWYSKEAIDHFRYLTWLHTDLIPLWMTLGKEAQLTGTPVIRPLVWNYQNDIGCWRVDDEFTVGDGLLVAPIMSENPEREIYLPDGLWYDFWDEKLTLKGPLKINWTKNREEDKYKFPVYIKEGTIIPMEINNEVTGFGTAESSDYVTLAIWPKSDSSSDFILNDTEGPVRITSESKTSNMLDISWSETRQDYILRIHIKSDKKVFEVKEKKGNIILKNYHSKEKFQENKDEGYYFDNTGGNIWIRKKNNGVSGILGIKLR